MLFFRQFTDHNLGTKVSITRQMTPFLFIYFLGSNCLYYSFLYLKIVKIRFWCCPPFGPFWSVKYLNSGQKLPIRITRHAFLESWHPEVTYNPYYLLSPKWRQEKGISSWTTRSSIFEYVLSRFSSLMNIINFQIGTILCEKKRRCSQTFIKLWGKQLCRSLSFELCVRGLQLFWKEAY